MPNFKTRAEISARVFALRIILSVFKLQTESFLNLNDDVSTDISGCVNRLSTDVGRYDEVVKAEERRIKASVLGETAVSKLVNHNVGAVAAEIAALKSFVNVFLINDTAAAHVENNSVLLHESDLLSGNKVLGLGGKGKVDGNEIGNLKQLFDAYALSLLLNKNFCREIRIVCNDVHLECTAKLAYALTDSAEAEYAEGTAAELTSYECILVPVLVNLNVVVSSHGAASKVKHLGDGKLCYCVAVESGCVEYLDALFLSVIHVDVVEANRANTDYLEVLGCVEDLLVDSGVNAHDKNVVIANDSLELVLSGEHLVVYLHGLAKFLSYSFMYSIDN